MAVWVWLGWLTLVWFGSALEDGGMIDPGGGSVSVWRFVNGENAPGSGLTF